MSQDTTMPPNETQTYASLIGQLLALEDAAMIVSRQTVDDANGRFEAASAMANRARSLRLVVSAVRSTVGVVPNRQ